MKKKSFLFFFIVALPLFAFAQKAYEAVYYKGKTQNIAVAFTLANGYLPACEIKTTDLKTKKTSSFLPEYGYSDKLKQIKFYHVARTGRTFSDYFIIDGMEEVYDDNPAKISGTYYFNGKAYPFTLLKK